MHTPLQCPAKADCVANDELRAGLRTAANAWSMTSTVPRASCCASCLARGPHASTDSRRTESWSAARSPVSSRPAELSASGPARGNYACQQTRQAEFLQTLPLLRDLLLEAT